MSHCHLALSLSCFLLFWLAPPFILRCVFVCLNVMFMLQWVCKLVFFYGFNFDCIIRFVYCAIHFIQELKKLFLKVKILNSNNNNNSAHTPSQFCTTNLGIKPGPSVIDVCLVNKGQFFFFCFVLLLCLIWNTDAAKNLSVGKDSNESPSEDPGQVKLQHGAQEKQCLLLLFMANNWSDNQI